MASYMLMSETDKDFLMGKDGDPMCWDTQAEAEEFIRLANGLATILKFDIRDAVSVVSNLSERFEVGEDDG